MIDLLVRLGLARRRADGKIRWPFYVWPRSHWGFLFRHCPVGVFWNLPGVIKWEPNRLLPRRWGIQLWMLEIGDRGDSCATCANERST